MGAIIVRRTAVSKMSAGALGLGIGAFAMGFFHPGFFPLAWGSFIGGGLFAVLIWNRSRRSSHPTVSHLAEDPDERRPIHPR
jgi:hypothetical protein